MTNRIKINKDNIAWAITRAGFVVDEFTEKNPSVREWIEGTKDPTIKQLEKFARQVSVPFGYLFLKNPPVETLPFPVFRGATGVDDRFRLNVYDTVLNIQSRQEWLEEYLSVNDIGYCDLVGSISDRTPIAETVDILRTRLGLDQRWAFSLSSADAAVGVLTERLEETNIFIAFNGVVGNNTHRVLSVDECRGFALVNNTAPYIFVNSGDAKTAQMFTLIHETAHIMLGVSAGHAGDEIPLHDAVERYCDAVAAEFLVPQVILRDIWNDDIKHLANRFKVSELVIARRAHDIGLLNDADYKRFWTEYSSRPVRKKNQSGGDFYLSSVKRVGRTFAIHIRNAVNNRELSYMDAYRLTGLYGNTFQRFMNNNI